MFFKFEEFSSNDWIVNADRLSGKTVILHYYSAMPRKKFKERLYAIIKTQRYDRKLFQTLIVS